MYANNWIFHHRTSHTNNRNHSVSWNRLCCEFNSLHFTDIPKLLAEALANGLSMEGAGEALSIGAAGLFLRVGRLNAEEPAGSECGRHPAFHRSAARPFVTPGQLTLRIAPAMRRGPRPPAPAI